MKKILILFIMLLALCGCTNEKETLSDSPLTKIIEEGNYIVIDVRTSEEYNEGHVKEAINIPYDEIDENIGIDKQKTILVYCQSGNRSKIAYNTLLALGYNVYDMGAFASVPLDKE